MRSLYSKRHRSEREDWFYSLFQNYHTRLTYFASKILPNNCGETPDDVVQEVFLKLWEKYPQFKFNGETKIKAFLYISVKNRCLNLCKHEKIVELYRSSARKSSLEKEIPAYMIEAETIEKIKNAICELPPKCKEVINLSYFEGLKNLEISKKLNVSINTIKTHKRIGLSRLREVLKSIYVLF